MAATGPGASPPRRSPSAEGASSPRGVGGVIPLQESQDEVQAACKDDEVAVEPPQPNLPLIGRREVGEYVRENELRLKRLQDYILQVKAERGYLSAGERNRRCSRSRA